MNVVEINSVCGQGSTGKIALDLYHILKENGHECHIVYGRGTAPENINSIKIGNQYTTIYHGCMSRLTGKHGFYSKRATKALIQKLRQMQIDVLHLHNIHGYYINIEELFAYIKEAHIKVIWTLHDCWTFTGQCAHFDYIQCDKWQKGCYNCPQLREYPKAFKDNSLYNYKIKKELFTDVKDLYIITPSYWLENLVKQSFMKNASIQTIHNGIDLTIFRPKDSDLRKKLQLQGKFLILCVANIWTSKKGYDHLLDLSTKLYEDEQIIMIGVSERQKKELPANIIGITRTKDMEELVKYYSMADVFVNPTLEDNYPTVNMEALACGTPVITYPTGGSVESILNEDVGYISSEKNVDALRVSLDYAREKKWNKETIRCYAEENFEKKHCFEKYLDLIETITMNKSSSNGESI